MAVFALIARRLTGNKGLILLFVVFVILCMTLSLQGLFLKSTIFDNTSKLFFQSLGHVKDSTLAQLTKEPERGKDNIIFIETTCALNPVQFEDIGLLLTKRQACSIESAAKINPDSSVYLLYTCPVRGGIEASLPHIKELLSYRNFKIWELDVPNFLKGTPLQEWDFHEKLSKSDWPIQHSSDVLRYVALWKYGGTYLDMDVIVRKPLKELGKNYAGKESDNMIGDCILNFSIDDVGHELSERCLSEMFNNFQGNYWNHNGPDTITKIFQQVCGTDQISEMNPDRCNGVQVYAKNNFMPLHYPQWGMLFRSTGIEEVMNMMKDSYIVHTWNSMSKGEFLNLMIETPFKNLGMEFCPRVLEYSISEINM